jgi:FlaA1/EpsC-like NDP-sugar epimerase
VAVLRFGRRRRRESGIPPAAFDAGLLGRDEVALPGERARRLINGRRVLITGAASLAGAALAGCVARLDPAVLDLIEGAEPDAAGLLDVTRPHLVFHAAGSAALAALEADPCEAVRVNVLATHRLVDAARRRGVEPFVLISTDKAADPASVYGATKRLAEMVAQTSAGSATCVATARLGTVLSQDALRSMRAGEVVVLTHPEVARNFMTAAEAAGLVIEAALLAEKSETFVLEMGGPTPVVAMVHRYAEQLGLPEVTIRFSGLGPGEKLAEQVFSHGEHQIRTAHPKIWATRPAPLPAGLPPILDALYGAARQGDDGTVRMLLRRLLPEYRPLRRPDPIFTGPESTWWM